MSDRRTIDIVAAWLSSVSDVLQSRETAKPLREVATAGNLGEWTRLLTTVVFTSCKQLGWPAAAKGHRLNLLPQAQQEYLGIDVMAFPPGTGESGPMWPFPLAVFELENQPGRAAYSLWKVMCVRAELRVVFAYRNDWDQVKELIRSLKHDVIEGFTIEERMRLDDRILVVTGSRGEGETFPYGYFKVWRLNQNIGDFERLSGWG
jgi:hypothetical protein